MADFEGGLPIKTVRDNDAAVKLVDGSSGSSATKKLTIAQEGDAIVASTNDFGVPVFGEDNSGNYKLLSLDASGALNIAAADLDIRDLTHVSDSVKIGDGTDFLAVNNDGSINAVVTATDLDIRDLAFATDSVDVSGSSVSITGDVNVTQGTSPWVVSATDLDIRDLAFATDKVDVSGSSNVAVVDGGGSLTVDAVDLDIRDLTHASDSVKIGDGTDFLAISATGEASVEITNAQGADGAAAPSEALQVAGKDGSGNLQVLKTNTAGNLEVVVLDAIGAEICNFQTTATVGANSTTNHEYVVTNATTFTKMQVLVGARGATKVRVGTWDGVTFVVKAAYFQQIQDNKDHFFPMFQVAGDGSLAIRIEISNLDGQSSDLYSTLQGLEV